jgi:hypothetical protein
MPSVAIMTITFACLAGGVLLGMGLRVLLPRHHLSQVSLDAIKIATRLMATLAALVLGLLISSANSTHNLVEGEYRQTLVSIVLLDRSLGQYGPQSEDARALLRRLFIGKIQEIWPQEAFGVTEVPAVRPEIAIERVDDMVVGLAPSTDAQKWYRSQALEMLNQVQQLRWLLMSQQVASAIPAPFLAVLIVWATMIFVSFGLVSRTNPTVIAALFICALTVSAAIFMIFELNNPFYGMIKISSAPARAVLAVLGH